MLPNIASVLLIIILIEIIILIGLAIYENFRNSRLAMTYIFPIGIIGHSIINIIMWGTQEQKPTFIQGISYIFTIVIFIMLDYNKEK